MADYSANIAEKKEANKPLTAESKKKFGFLDELQNKADIVAEMVEGGKHAPYVGFGTDTKYNIASRFEDQVDPVEIDLRQAVATLGNVNLYMRSGMAINEEEAKRIIKELPSTEEAPDVFARKFANYQRVLDQSMKKTRELEGAKRGDFKDPAAAPVSSQPKGAPATQKGIPPGRVPMINPQGKPVTLPAAQVSEALKAGYQPYGAQ